MGEKQHEQPVTIRFPPHILDAAREAARDEKRSLNAQIVWIVEQYLKERERRARK